MDVIDYNAKKQVLISVKGHPFDRTAFFDIFESQNEFGFNAVEQPATEHLIRPGVVDNYAALVFYDMPGLDFSEMPPRFVAPSETYKQDFLALTEKGVGMVFLHHTIAAWPTWHEYAEIVGGRFLYTPDRVRGREVPDSGYLHAVDYQAKVLCQHPVTDGVPDAFAITDELYLCEVFEDSVVPILASDFSFTTDKFNSAFDAVGGSQPKGWPARTGSRLIGWIKHYKNSPIVYLQPGDAVAVFSNPLYRRLVLNAVNWVASPAAGEWARGCNFTQITEAS